MRKGFTLVEILIVMALIGILVVIILPSYRSSLIRAKEAVLKENLFVLRESINKFYFDKKKYPTSLEELVFNKYLRELPMNPFTNEREWELIYFEAEDIEEYDPELMEGIIDIKSSYRGKALDDSQYSDW